MLDGFNSDGEGRSFALLPPSLYIDVRGENFASVLKEKPRSVGIELTGKIPRIIKPR